MYVNLLIILKCCSFTVCPCVLCEVTQCFKDWEGKLQQIFCTIWVLTFWMIAYGAINRETNFLFFTGMHFSLIVILIIKWNQNFAHVPSAQLNWHVQNHDLIGPLLVALKQSVCFQDLDYGLKYCLWNGEWQRCYSIVKDMFRRTIFSYLKPVIRV